MNSKFFSYENSLGQLHSLVNQMIAYKVYGENGADRLMATLNETIDANVYVQKRRFNTVAQFL